jgi:iron complex outermembrane recepter protein
MKYKYTFITLFVTTRIFAQNEPVFISDTIQIKEVVISKTIPLNDNNRLNQAHVADLNSIDEINARLGGMSLISRGAYAKEPLINSFSAGQINVTIDGMKMFGACTDKMDPITSYIEPTNLSQIDLSHGTNGGENGSTVGGTFNMLLEKPDLNKFDMAGSMHYETVSKGKTGYATINFGRKYWAYRMNGVVKDFKSYHDGNNNLVPFTQYKKLNLFQSLMLAPNNKYNLIFNWLIDDAIDIGYPALPMDVSKAQGRIYSVTFNHEKIIPVITKFQLKLYANTVYHLMDDSQRDSLFFVKNYRTGLPDSIYMKMDMPGWSNTYGGFMQWYSALGDKNTLFFKLENYYNWSKAEMTMYMNNLSNPGEPPMYAETWPEHERNVTGIFLKNTTHINNNISVSFDIRADLAHSQILSEQGKNQFLIFVSNPGKKYDKLVKTANLNVFWHPVRNLNFTTGTGFGERLPTLSEQFGFYLFNAFDGYDYIGNPDLKTEKAFNFWTNIEYAKPKFKFTFEAYANFMDDYILGTITPEYQALNLYASGVKKYSNIDGVFLLSANSQLLWKPINNVEFFLVTKYNYGQIAGNEPLPLINPFKSVLNITWEKKDWYLQAESEYAATQNRINKDFGEKTTSSYILFHFRCAYNLDVQNVKLQIRFAVENIFNSAYSEHLDWGDYYRQGRNFKFGIIFNL